MTDRSVLVQLGQQTNDELNAKEINLSAAENKIDQALSLVEAPYLKKKLQELKDSDDSAEKIAFLIYDRYIFRDDLVKLAGSECSKVCCEYFPCDNGTRMCHLCYCC